MKKSWYRILCLTVAAMLVLNCLPIGISTAKAYIDWDSTCSQSPNGKHSVELKCDYTDIGDDYYHHEHYVDYCIYCGGIFAEDTADNDHNYHGLQTKQPTCSQDGYTYYHCDQCGHTAIEDRFPATGHNWSGWSVTQSSNCNREGYQSRTCSRCGATETQTIARDNHRFTLSKEEDGVKWRGCERCGLWIQEGSLARGDHSLLILIMQQLMADQKIYSGNVDGTFGPRTEESLVKYMTSHGFEGVSVPMISNDDEVMGALVRDMMNANSMTYGGEKAWSNGLSCVFDYSEAFEMNGDGTHTATVTGEYAIFSMNGDEARVRASGYTGAELNRTTETCTLEDHVCTLCGWKDIQPITRVMISFTEPEVYGEVSDVYRAVTEPAGGLTQGAANTVLTTPPPSGAPVTAEQYFRADWEFSEDGENYYVYEEDTFVPGYFYRLNFGDYGFAFAEGFALAEEAEITVNETIHVHAYEELTSACVWDFTDVEVEATKNGRSFLGAMNYQQGIEGVKDFQIEAGINPTGTLTGETLHQLNLHWQERENLPLRRVPLTRLDMDRLSKVRITCYISNNDGTHTAVRNGQILGTENCSLGNATVTSTGKRVVTCDKCGYTVALGIRQEGENEIPVPLQPRYGSWHSNRDGTHSRTALITYGSGFRERKLRMVETENCYGGEADCGRGAFCDACGDEYTEPEGDHHWEWMVVGTGEVIELFGVDPSTVEKCLHVNLDDVSHFWANRCTVCGEWYFVVLWDEMGSDSYTATIRPVMKTDADHVHTGGTATCAEQAICEICGEYYGEYGEHVLLEGTELGPRSEYCWGYTVYGKCAVCGEHDNIKVYTGGHCEVTDAVLPGHAMCPMEAHGCPVCGWKYDFVDIGVECDYQWQPVTENRLEYYGGEEVVARYLQVNPEDVAYYEAMICTRCGREQFDELWLEMQEDAYTAAIRAVLKR